MRRRYPSGRAFRPRSTQGAGPPPNPDQKRRQRRFRALVYLCWGLGYLLVAWGLAGLLTPWIWPIAGGLALLGGAGLRATGVLLWAGAYHLGTSVALSKEKRTGSLEIGFRDGEVRTLRTNN